MGPPDIFYMHEDAKWMLSATTLTLGQQLKLKVVGKQHQRAQPPERTTMPFPPSYSSRTCTSKRAGTFRMGKKGPSCDSTCSPFTNLFTNRECTLDRTKRRWQSRILEPCVSSRPRTQCSQGWIAMMIMKRRLATVQYAEENAALSKIQDKGWLCGVRTSAGGFKWECGSSPKP